MLAALLKPMQCRSGSGWIHMILPNPQIQQVFFFKSLFYITVSITDPPLRGPSKMAFKPLRKNNALDCSIDHVFNEFLYECVYTVE